MATVCLDSVFGKKILQWNKEIKNSIQMENVNIAKKGEKIRKSYLDLVDAVSLRYNVTLQLQQELNRLPSISKEIELMQENINGFCNKMDKLNEFYNNVLTEQHNARIMHEKNEQKKYLNIEEQKCKKKLNEEIQSLKEMHNILKIQELGKRKQEKSSNE
eukprot:40965_1